MRWIFLLTLVLTGFQAHAGLKCWGLKRELVENDQVKETHVDLVQDPHSGGALVLQGQIETWAFNVTRLAPQDDYMIGISVGPDYTEGILATTAVTSDHRLQISTVKGALVLKLECSETN